MQFNDQPSSPSLTSMLLNIIQQAEGLLWRRLEAGPEVLPVGDVGDSDWALGSRLAAIITDWDDRRLLTSKLL